MFVHVGVTCAVLQQGLVKTERTSPTLGGSARAIKHFGSPPERTIECSFLQLAGTAEERDSAASKPGTSESGRLREKPLGTR